MDGKYVEPRGSSLILANLQMTNGKDQMIENEMYSKGRIRCL